MDDKPTKIEERQGVEKSAFIEHFKKMPITSVICKQIGVSRSTIYRWFREDREFYNNYLEAEKEGREYMNDAMESSLINLAKNENITAIIFYLKYNHPRYSDSFGALTPQVIKEVADYIENSEDIQNDSKFLSQLFSKRIPIKVGRYILQIMRRLSFSKKNELDERKENFLSKLIKSRY